MKTPLVASFVRSLLLATACFVGLSLDVTGDDFAVAAASAKPKPKPKGKDKAAADDKKDDKKADKADKSDDKKDDKADEKKEEKKDEKLRTTGPAAIKRDAFSGKQFDNSAKADRKRDEQIDEIKKVLPKMRGKSQEGELVFRLAEIFWDKSKFVYQTEFKEFDETYQRWVDGGRQGKEPQLQTYLKKSDAYKKQALDNYQIVLEKFPDYPRLDEVLYIMAYNQYEAGKNKEAVDNYSQLIRQYPKSEYVPDSYLALGEHYFKGNDLAKSTKAYKKAFDVGEERKRIGTANYALYKLAWCDYNAQTYEDALTKFKQVIKRSGIKDGKKNDTEGIQLRREALNDMVLTFSQLDSSKDAYDYLKKEAGAEEGYRLTGKLAAVYKEQGKHALQIDTLRLLINVDPDNAQAPDYQSSIVQAYSNLGDRPSVKKEVTRLVELYRPGSAWWRKNENNQANVERARAIAENRLRDLVTDYHRFAQKFKKYDDYEVAASIYSEYLKAFPDSDQAYRLNFFYAELLWDLGKWREAAGEYDAVVKRDAKGEYTRTCAFNAVLAWEKIVNKVPPPAISPSGKMDIDDCTPDDEKAGKCKMKKKAGEIKKEKVVIEKLDKTKKGSTKYDPQPIPEDEVKLAAACDAYVAVVTDKEIDKDPKLKEELQVVKFKAAYIYQSRYHFDDGAKRYGELIERWPESEYARTGAGMILDSYAFREDYPALEKWSRTFGDKKELMKDAKFASLARDLMEGATFKNTDKLREDAQTKKDNAAQIAAAVKFDAFVKEFPKSKVAPLAIYNMQLLYANTQTIDLAQQAADRLLKEFPKEVANYKFTLGEGSKEQDLGNKLELDTYANMPAYYEKMANYESAAEWYVKFADKYKDNPKSPDSIYNAGIFYLGLGDTENAVKMFTRYLKDFPKQKDLPDVYLRMASVYEDKEDWKRTAALYGDFEKLHGKDAKPEQILNARYKTALALQKAGRDKDMIEACQGILASYKKADDKLKKSEVGSTAAGYCAYHTLESEWLDYKAIKIEARAGTSGKKGMKVVAEALDQKKKKRDEIAKKYYDIKDYGSGEWAVAGLLRASDALIDYVDTLRSAPDPAALANNPEAIDIFRTELENVAFPVEEQAINALEAALETAFKLGIYSPYTIEIEERLKRYKPSRFPRVYELKFFPSAAVAAPTRTASR